LLARLGVGVAVLVVPPLGVVGLGCAVTTLVNVEVGLAVLAVMLFVVKTTDVVALGKLAIVEVRI
jgi:hypothetical protein